MSEQEYDPEDREVMAPEPCECNCRPDCARCSPAASVTVGGECNACDGTGRWGDQRCPKCIGTGRAPSEPTVEKG